MVLLLLVVVDLEKKLAKNDRLDEVVVVAEVFVTILVVNSDIVSADTEDEELLLLLSLVSSVANRALLVTSNVAPGFSINATLIISAYLGDGTGIRI